MDKDELILRPAIYGNVLSIVAGSIFVYAGIYMMATNPFLGWVTTIFFGFCLLVALLQLLPGSSQLKLTREGFEMTSLFRTHFTRWEDIQGFKTGFVWPRRMVVFNYVDSHRKFRFGKRLAKGLSGNEAALPESYGMKPAALAQLMNDWKDRATQKA